MNLLGSLIRSVFAHSPAPAPSQSVRRVRDMFEESQIPLSGRVKSSSSSSAASSASQEVKPFPLMDVPNEILLNAIFPLMSPQDLNKLRLMGTRLRYLVDLSNGNNIAAENIHRLMSAFFVIANEMGGNIFGFEGIVDSNKELIFSLNQDGLIEEMAIRVDGVQKHCFKCSSDQPFDDQLREYQLTIHDSSMDCRIVTRDPKTGERKASPLTPPFEIKVYKEKQPIETEKQKKALDATIKMLNSIACAQIDEPKKGKERKPWFNWLVCDYRVITPK